MNATLGAANASTLVTSMPVDVGSVFDSACVWMRESCSANTTITSVTNNSTATTTARSGSIRYVKVCDTSLRFSRIREILSANSDDRNPIWSGSPPSLIVSQNVLTDG